MSIRARRAGLAVAFCALVLGCATEPTGGSGARRSTVSIDLSGARRAGSPGRVSVASRIVLTVTPAAGDAQTLTAELKRGQFSADFEVAVPDGGVRFQVEVFNSDELLLFSGDTTQEIREDGFQVLVDLLARKPFLVVGPDSLARDTSTTNLGLLATTLDVRNVGVDTLQWQLNSVVGSTASTPPLEYCAHSPTQPCLQISPFQGSLLPRTSDQLRLRATAAKQEAYRLLFGSNVGGVEVEMVVPAAYSGRGSATLDGRITAQEWGAAPAISFPVALGGGQTTAGTLRIMNDDSFLYLSLAFRRDSVGWASDRYIVSLDFDDDADGAAADGDDGLVASLLRPTLGDTLLQSGIDDYRVSPPDCPPGPLCRLPDGSDDAPNDGHFAARNDGQNTMIEIAKPLQSSDPQHDFSLQPTRMVGFQILTSFTTGSALTNSYWPAGDAWAVFVVR
jgi:hypothetical protein